jgi:hypothetical protein
MEKLTFEANFLLEDAGDGKILWELHSLSVLPQIAVKNPSKIGTRPPAFRSLLESSDFQALASLH